MTFFQPQLFLPFVITSIDLKGKALLQQTIIFTFDDFIFGNRTNQTKIFPTFKVFYKNRRCAKVFLCALPSFYPLFSFPFFIIFLPINDTRREKHINIPCIVFIKINRPIIPTLLLNDMIQRHISLIIWYPLRILTANLRFNIQR